MGQIFEIFGDRFDQTHTYGSICAFWKSHRTISTERVLFLELCTVAVAWCYFLLLLVDSALALALSLGMFLRTTKCSLCRDFIVLSHFKAESSNCSFLFLQNENTFIRARGYL